ncbi:phage portal protein [Paenibacillus alvei]|uniref:phage portal protein n=1 Tax=Paenibacillus alvei TaxID=44250 RepID=UPI0022816B62|nr:phage portal protein [Paenibacillus alvei]MCY7486035.1 phage portal protein [Paenibacillus alvei]
MLTYEQAHKLWQAFKRDEQPRLQKLYDYYVGKHAILARQDRENRETHRVVNNFARYISTVATGFFMGSPVAYTCDGDAFDAATDILEESDAEAVDYDLALNCSIYGRSYELFYIDENKELRFKDLDPRTVIIVKDGSMKERITSAIVFSDRKTEQDKIELRMDIYDDKEVATYTSTMNADYKGFDYVLKEKKQHFIGGVPVNEYMNNRFGLGDYEDCISLMDAYNKAASNSVDDLSDFTDAFLALINMSGTEPEDINRMRKDKVLLLEGDGDAKWLIKNVDSSYSDGIKTRIQTDIHKFSFVPDMSDEKFAGNLSGVAIKYKLLALEQLRGQKERQFRKGLWRRLEIVHSYMKLMGSDVFDFTKVKMQFNANLPANLVEMADVIEKLDGKVPLEILLSLLPFISDVKQAVKMLEKERSERFDDPYSDLGKQEEKKDDDGKDDAA